MAQMKQFGILFALFFCTLSPISQAGDTMYVSSKHANVYRAASLDSEVLQVLSRQDQVEVLNEKGIWFQVRVPVASGWLSRYSISATPPPENKISILSRLKNFFEGDNKRARLTLVSTAGGLRNLTEEESDAIGKTDFSALRQMESIELSELEIDEFAAGGPI